MSSSLNHSFTRARAPIAAALGMLLFATAARAQGPPPPPPEMCGDGTKFDVQLPVVDTSPGGGVVAPFAELNPDSIFLPKGCSMYLLIVSDLGRNRRFNELLFYPLARFVAQHNGYVHYAWWNNLLRPYMAGPVHSFDAGLDDFVYRHPGERFSHDGGEVYRTLCDYQGGLIGLEKQLCEAYRFLSSSLAEYRNRPFPDSMHQLTADATKLVNRVREENPEAVLIVAGHGLGGHAITLIPQGSHSKIDLMAPIDPYGSTSEKDGSEVTFSEGGGGLRSRTVKPISYYARRDCVRTFLNLCRNDGTLFSPKYACYTRNERLTERPPIGSFAPIACGLSPTVYYAKRVIGTKRLYYRWQTEIGPPSDYSTFAENFTFTGDQAVASAMPKSYSTAGQLCSDDALHPPGLGTFWDSLWCSPSDGHDEMVGIVTRRVEGDFLGIRFHAEHRALDGVLGWNANDDLEEFEHCGGSCPSRDLSQQLTRQLLLDTLNAETPLDILSELCLVCSDMVAIAQELYDEHFESGPTLPSDTTAPTTRAETDPGANPQRWYDANVIVELIATDAGGVQEIVTSLAGAQSSSPTTTAGGFATQSITTEGTTTVTYFARDVAGNSETPRILEVRLDKTAPEIHAVPDPAPNVHGWNNGDVQVSFVASDALSGLASVTSGELVSTEGAEKEIPGSAEDNAGNTAGASEILNIDRTAPVITLESHAPAANSAGWNNTDVSLLWNCSDALSGPVANQVSQSVSAEGAAQNVIGQCVDQADNSSSDARSVNLDKTSPTSQIVTPPEGAVYLVNAVVDAAYSCADSLSGVSACAGPVSPGARIDTATVGGQTFTVNAADAAGNQGASSHAYAVQYSFSGFSNPIAPMPTINSATAGRTVPVKYLLRDANGVVISNLASFVSLASAPVACDTNVPTAAAEESDAAGSTGIRFELDKFIYNWQTSAVWQGTCRVLQLTLNDGTEHMVAFKFK